MFQRESRLYTFMHSYCHSLADGIPEDQMTTQPAANVNHPAWILGHLAVATDYALQCLGEPGVCPREWHTTFAPGSKPLADRAAYPSRAELLTVLDAGYARVIEAARNPDLQRMQQSHTVPFDFLKQYVPTVGDLLAHLMTTHLAAHLGQLSMWRRLMGLPGVMSI